MCRAGLAQHPAYLSARITLGRALLEMGRYDEAVSEFEYVLKAAPDNLTAIRELADIEQRGATSGAGPFPASHRPPWRGAPAAGRRSGGRRARGVAGRPCRRTCRSACPDLTSSRRGMSASARARGAGPRRADRHDAGEHPLSRQSCRDRRNAASSRPGDVQLLVDFRYKEAVRSLQDSPAACPGLRIWDVPDSYDEALVSATMASSAQGRWHRGRSPDRRPSGMADRAPGSPGAPASASAPPNGSSSGSGGEGRWPK